MIEVLKHAPDALTWRERYALVVLAENANDGTRECWPGIEDDPEIALRMRIPGRSSRYDVLKALREKGALKSVSSGHRGRRAVYRIPAMGPGTTDAIDVAKGPESADPMSGKGPGTPDEGSGNDGPNHGSKGPETTDPNGEKGSGNHGQRVRDPRTKGPDSTDPFPSVPSVPSASQPASPPGLDYGIPEDARPLVNGITAAGVTVRWPFKGDAWFPILAMIKKSGVTAMIEHALKAAARTDIESANYFLKGWRELPPLPPPDAERPPLRALPGGYQPYRQPDPSVYKNDQGF